MKTDLVLTMDEYLDQYCVIPKRLSPPARDARHISIKAEDQVEIRAWKCTVADGINGVIPARVV